MLYLDADKKNSCNQGTIIHTIYTINTK